MRHFFIGLKRVLLYRLTGRTTPPVPARTFITGMSDAALQHIRNRVVRALNADLMTAVVNNTYTTGMTKHVFLLL
jgi:hypothetical protein